MKKVQFRSMSKRVLSVLLILCMVFVMLPAEDLFAAAKRVVSDSKGDSTNEYNILNDYYMNGTAKKITRTRRVIKDAAFDGIITNSSKTKGTVENPFIILEVVTYKDYSSIGYLVDGCEPINMDSLRGNEMAIKDLTDESGDFFGFGKFTLAPGDIFYFPDEEEGKSTFYQNTNLTDEEKDGVAPKSSELRFVGDAWTDKYRNREDDNKDILGYYEVVEQGKGTFVLKEETALDGTVTRSIVNAADTSDPEHANTTLVWHTVNNYLLNQYRAEGVYNDRLFLSMSNLNNAAAFARLKINYSEANIGNRFYTVRQGGADDPYYDLTGCLYNYQSNDLFVKNTLGISDANAKNYSVTVKTITPAELKANPDWIDKADIVYFNCDLKSFADKANEDDETNGVRDENEAALIDLYQSQNKNGAYLNRFNTPKDANTASTDADKRGFRGANELDGDIAYTILKRITKQNDYLALIIDSVCVDSNYTTTSGNNITYYMYDLKTHQAISGGWGELGYKNNLAKLWLACTSANPGFSQRFFIDSDLNASGVPTVEKGGVTTISDIVCFNNSYMSDDEKEYWSGMSFYCAEERYVGKTRTALKEPYWKNYAGDIDHDDDPYFVQGHVFVTPSGKTLVDGYVEQYSSSDLAFAETKYEDYNDYLAYLRKDFKANQATASLAARYVLDVDKYVNYYFDSVTALDLEPSVAYKNGLLSYQFEFEDVLRLIPKRIGYETRVDKVDHRTMTEFIATDIDLNSEYDLIYIGDDATGLWTNNDLVHVGYESGYKVGEIVTGTKRVWKPNDRQSKNAWYRKDTPGFFDDGYRNANDYWGGESGYYENQGRWVDEPIKEDLYNIYGSELTYDRTNFVDNRMDGLVYFHVGDWLKVSDTSYSDFIGGDNTKTRQAGNDITVKKKNALIDYLMADYPIVISDNLYAQYKDPSITYPYVDKDPACELNKFFNQYNPSNNGAYSYYTKDMLDKIDKMVKNRLKGRVTFTDQPELYPTYLDDTNGYAVLKFGVNVPNTTDYFYRVFVDRNRDSHFSYSGDNDDKNEVITVGYSIGGEGGYLPLSSLQNNLRVGMPEKWVGFVQWRIEVIRKDNPHKRYSLEGCSAVKADPTAPANDDRAKKKIIALQIMPTHNHNQENGTTATKPDASVDLANKKLNGKNSSATITSDMGDLYSQVNDFEIEVVKITWRQFMQLFTKENGTSEGFQFNMGEPIDYSLNNPSLAVKNEIESKPLAFCENNGNYNMTKELNRHPANPDNYYKLEDFNMIILGFDDAYGMTDMSNAYGAVEYLYYFSQKGCSLLFTHDTTSQNSAKLAADSFSWANISGDKLSYEVRAFGYTGNNMMREIMGMNRYMKISNRLDDSGEKALALGFRDGLRQQIEKYVDLNDIEYDHATGDGLHGFSLYNLARYVAIQSNVASQSSNNKYRMQWKYMVIDPKDGEDGKDKAKGGTYSGNGGDPNAFTIWVERTNEGQITQYPFTLPTNFRIGLTHGQWWQLNMEDEDLTVWYTLADPAVMQLGRSNTTLGKGNVTYTLNDFLDRSSSTRDSQMYSAVPRNAADNYYIFSKGNIFYSGVGHSALGSTDEKKLFVNTLVAAYRPKYDLPTVQVTSGEASLTQTSPYKLYTVSLPVDYIYDNEGNLDDIEVLLSDGTEFSSGDYIYIKFKAIDNNGCPNIYTNVSFLPSVGGDPTEDIKVYGSLTDARNNTVLSTTSNVVERIGTEDVTVKYYELTVGNEYYIRYKKSDLNESGKSLIMFKSYNNRLADVNDRDRTYLQIKTQPLFLLD